MDIPLMPSSAYDDLESRSNSPMIKEQDVGDRTAISAKEHPNTNYDDKQEDSHNTNKIGARVKSSDIHDLESQSSKIHQRMPKRKAEDPTYVPPKKHSTDGDDDEQNSMPKSNTVGSVIKSERRDSIINKSTMPKRRTMDPSYIPRKEEYSSDDGEQHTSWLRTPKQTPRKRKTLPEHDGGPTSSVGKTAHQTPKKRKTGKVADSAAMAYATPPDSISESSQQVMPTSETWGQGDDASDPDYLNESLADGIPAGTPQFTHGRTISTKSGPSSPTDLATIHKKKKADMPTFEPGQSDDEDRDEDLSFRISKNEKTGVVFDFSLEKAKRWADAINIPEGVYNIEESDLFSRLAMRGFEPLVPRSWRYDFPTLPELLYPSLKDTAEALIQSLGASNFYGIKSLAHLFSLGGRVRDCDILRARPEPLIGRYVRKYIRWALEDAKVHIAQDAIPVHTIHTQKRRETTLNAVKKINRRLQRLASRYHHIFGHVSSEAHASHLSTEDLSGRRPKYPLLVGFVICGPIIAILTLGTNPSETSEKTDSKFISQFDLSEKGQDVWNSLAVAIVVMHIRRTMIQLADEGLGGFSRLAAGPSPASMEDL